MRSWKIVITMLSIALILILNNNYAGGSMVVPPYGFNYSKQNSILKWQEQSGASGYYIELSKDGSNYDKIYEGTNAYCNIELDDGIYYLRGVTQNRPDSEMSSPIELVVE